MTDLELLIDLHKDGHRQGPGGDEQTRLAIELSGLKDQPNLEIADIGCGTGASTMLLAQELDAHITAVDLCPEFLKILDDAIAREDLSDRIATRAESMDALSIRGVTLDAIWSEGAIYNMGFENGVRSWREFLKPGGILAISELTWLTGERPEEVEAYWNAQYPEVDTASAKMAILENAGYAPIGYFPLPKQCWIYNYYRPTQTRFEAFLDRHGEIETARALVAAEREEMAVYERWSDYFGYGFYIARRLAD